MILFDHRVTPPRAASVSPDDPDFHVVAWTDEDLNDQALHLLSCHYRHFSTSAITRLTRIASMTYRESDAEWMAEMHRILHTVGYR